MTLSRRRRTSASKPRSTAGRGGSRLPWVLLAIAVLWGSAATVYAVSGQRAFGRLSEEAVVRQSLSDDKVRALTRRLVGVASHQVLEQEGLTERLADIVTRQVDLENREAALSAMADRALAGTAAPQDAAPQDRPRRGTGRDGELATGKAFAALPLRDQFGRIETSLKRIDADQRHFVVRLAGFARAVATEVRAVLASLRLTLAPPKPLPPPASEGPSMAFAGEVAATEAALAEAGRWRALVEWVPLRPPIDGEGNTTSNFGPRKDPFTGGQRMHAGMDFRSPVGTQVHTAAGGRVITAGPSGGYGNLVEIDHGHDIITRYGHLSAIEVSVAQAVPAGMVVGLVGSTGRSTGPHLHYETRLSGSAVDPALFLAAGRRLSGREAPAPDAPSGLPPGGQTATDDADAAD